MKEYTDAWLKESGFPERLRQARKAADMTQNDVAYETYTSVSQIARMEKGEVAPSIAKVVELADLYGISVDWLCGRTDNNGNDPE